MPTPASVQKRTGEIVPFKAEKIYNAAHNALVEVNEETADEMADKAQTKTINKIKKSEETIPSVDQIHRLVEESLMDLKQYDAARAYFSYRKEHMPDIFRERENVKPYEYPDLLEYMWAIYDSFWTRREFSTQFKSDIHDMKVNLDEKKYEALRRSMLAISTVEVKAVKDYWGRLHDRMPKTEIAMVGAAFANNEIIHLDTYAHLLEIMGLNKDFEKVKEIPALQKRLDYLKQSMNGRHGDNKEFTRTLILFALFTENVSLFSQFLIMMSVNKHENLLKGISNAVQATSKEEDLHALFGITLVNIVRNEHPEWFDEEMDRYVNDMLHVSYNAERDIIDWIFECGEWDYLTKHDLDQFIKDRYNQSMVACGFEAPFDDIDEELIQEKFEWFEVEARTTNRVDFFNKKNTNYKRNDVSITAYDLV